jgi:low affinity Fe/Cu permease
MIIGHLQNIVLIIVMMLLIVGALPTWPYSKAWDYYPISALGVILVLILMLVLLERL